MLVIIKGGVMEPKVLIFDSGVGGLSIYQEVIKQNHLIQPCYLFDNSFYPYGTKAEVEIIERVCKLLIAFIESEKPDLIVIACNTASTVALDAIRRLTTIPIVGVVPAIKPAALKTKNGIIGLLATPATVGRAYTADLIKKYCRNLEVLKIGTSRLVDLAEQKLAGKKILIDDIANILRPWLILDTERRPDTVILGCTHFPHLIPEIQQIYPNALLVDSGEAIGRRVKKLLNMNEFMQYSEIQPIVGKAYCTNIASVSKELRDTFKKFGFGSIEEFIV